jgi:hypothetical protein
MSAVVASVRSFNVRSFQRGRWSWPLGPGGSRRVR